MDNEIVMANDEYFHMEILSIFKDDDENTGFLSYSKLFSMEVNIDLNMKYNGNNR